MQASVYDLICFFQELRNQKTARLVPKEHTQKYAPSLVRLHVYFCFSVTIIGIQIRKKDRDTANGWHEFMDAVLNDTLQL